MAKLAWIVVLALWMSLPAPALAEPQAAQTPLRTAKVSGVEVLRGATPRTQHFLNLGAENERLSDVSLAFRLRSSSTVRRDTSLLHVLLDGRPVVSARLSELGAESVLNLKQPSAGFHRLEIRLELLENQPICRRDTKSSLWVELSELKAEWQVQDRPPSSVAEELSRWAQVPVQIEVETSARQSLATYLSAHEWLRRRGVEIATGRTPVTRKLTFSIDRSAGAPAVMLSPDGLRVTAAHADEWASAVRYLLQPEVGALCGETSCELPVTHDRADSLAAEMAQATAPQEGTWGALSESELTLRGEGELVLQLPVAVPSEWTLTPDSGVEVLVQLSQALWGQPMSAHIDLSFNGAPMESWRIDLSKQGEQSSKLRLWAPLPPAALTRSNLPLALRIALRSKDAAPCARQLDDGIWMRIEPSSGVRFHGKRRVVASLADLVSTFARRPPLMVSRDLAAAELHATAELLWPLSLQLSGRGGWRVEDSCQRCIEVVSGNDPRLPAALDLNATTPRWRSRPWGTELPAVAARGTTLLTRFNNSLLLAFGPEPRASGAWTRSHSTGALLGLQAPVFFGTAPGVEVVLLNPSKSHLSQPEQRVIGSSEQSFWRRQSIWLAAFILLVVALLLWLRRPLLPRESR